MNTKERSEWASDVPIILYPILPIVAAIALPLIAIKTVTQIGVADILNKR